jgi:hypothetical protein
MAQSAAEEIEIDRQDADPDPTRVPQIGFYRP